MAKNKKRGGAPGAQAVPASEEIRPSDEELFIEEPNRPFWAAKRLNARRASRFHSWLNKVFADMTAAIGSIDFSDLAGMDWSAIVSKAASILSDDNYFEILSIASGHTKEEIMENEAEYDYYEAWRCVADFVEINRLGSVLKNFFLPVWNLWSQRQAAKQEDQPSA